MTIQADKYVKVEYIEEGRDEPVTVRIIDKRTKEILFEWRDNANIDYPEDLCWSRMIGDLFFNAFKIGYKYGRKK